MVNESDTRQLVKITILAKEGDLDGIDRSIGERNLSDEMKRQIANILELEEGFRRSSGDYEQALLYSVRVEELRS